MSEILPFWSKHAKEVNSNILKPTQALTNCFIHLNSATDCNKSDDHDNLLDCKFRDKACFKSLTAQLKTKSLSLSSYSLLNELETNFNIFSYY